MDIQDLSRSLIEGDGHTISFGSDKTVGTTSPGYRQSMRMVSPSAGSPTVLTDRQWLDLFRPHYGSDFGVAAGRGSLQPLIRATVPVCRREGLLDAAAAHAWLKMYRCQRELGYLGGGTVHLIAQSCSEAAHENIRAPASGFGFGPAHTPASGIADTTGLSDTQLLGLLRDEVPSGPAWDTALAQVLQASRPDAEHQQLATDAQPMLAVAHAVAQHRRGVPHRRWSPGPLLLLLVEAMRHRDGQRATYTQLRADVGLPV